MTYSNFWKKESVKLKKKKEKKMKFFARKTFLHKEKEINPSNFTEIINSLN